MILYADTSALLKRVIIEPESAAIRALLAYHYAAADLVTSSSVAWLEVWRALRRVSGGTVGELAAQAMSGVAEHPLTPELLNSARMIGPDTLRSLDALHLVSAVAVGAEAMLTYDRGLADAAPALGLSVLAPG